jgi:tripartite-type tricarboxylate transporter receptor subunit TctC
MRRALPVLAAAIAAGCAVAADDTLAQAWPAKPVKLVVGFAPAGAADYVARTLSEPLAKALGQPVLIENRAGAGSSIAAEYVAKAVPDGYTFLIASPSSISVNPAVNPKLGYSARDLAAVTQVTSSPLVVAVNTGLGIRSIGELIAAAKKSPGKFNYATSGNGSAPHLSTIQFIRLAHVDIVHVPFKGGGPAVQSVVAGDTQLTFGTPPSVLPLVQAGRLKGLAVTSRERSPLVPDLPGMREAGLPDYDMSFWYGFFVPAGTPQAAMKRIFDATQGVLQLPQVKAALAREGTEAVGSKSIEEFTAFVAEDAKFWIKLVKESKLTVD